MCDPVAENRRDGENGIPGPGDMKILGLILVCVALAMLFPQAQEWFAGGGWSPDTIHEYIPVVYPADVPAIVQETIRFLFELPAALIPGLLGLFILWRAYAATG